MGITVGDKPPHELVVIRPRTTTEQSAERNKPSCGMTGPRAAPDVQGSEPRHVSGCRGRERKPEVHVQGLEVAALRTIRWREHEISDHCKRPLVT
jgi:hypothetical protein